MSEHDVSRAYAEKLAIFANYPRLDRLDALCHYFKLRHRLHIVLNAMDGWKFQKATCIMILTKQFHENWFKSKRVTVSFVVRSASLSYTLYLCTSRCADMYSML